MKRSVILVSRDGRPSMRLVYGQMNSGQLDIVRTPRKGGRYIRQYVSNNAETYNKVPITNLAYSDNIIIRWGNRIPIDTDNRTITYNKSEAIKTATDKKLSREIFMREGIRTSRLVTPENITANQYPVIARPFAHSKGRNFVVIHEASAFQGHYNANHTGWYYSEFIDKEREFRVHCAHGKVLDVMEKPRAEGIAWNRAQNHEAFFRVRQAEYIHDVCLQALKATKALGLDFAGVDVLLKDNQAYVLEANTSPTLNSSTHVSSRYARYFDWLARSESRREHFDFTNWKKADSFSWKNDQLSS